MYQTFFLFQALLKKKNAFKNIACRVVLSDVNITAWGPAIHFIISKTIKNKPKPTTKKISTHFSDPLFISTDRTVLVFLVTISISWDVCVAPSSVNFLHPPMVQAYFNCKEIKNGNDEWLDWALLSLNWKEITKILPLFLLNCLFYP